MQLFMLTCQHIRWCCWRVFGNRWLKLLHQGWNILFNGLLNILHATSTVTAPSMLCTLMIAPAASAWKVFTLRIVISEKLMHNLRSGLSLNCPFMTHRRWRDAWLFKRLFVNFLEDCDVDYIFDRSDHLKWILIMIIGLVGRSLNSLTYWTFEFITEVFIE